MKVLYLTYENVFATPILMSQVVSPLAVMVKRYDVEYYVTSCVKGAECGDVYKANKHYAEENVLSDGVFVKEFTKKLTNKQSILRFFIDMYPVFLWCISVARKVDVVHARSYGAALLGLLLKLIYRKPLIFDMRGVLPEETVMVGKIKAGGVKYRVLKIVERVLLFYSDYVFTVSDKFTDYLLKRFNLPADKVLNVKTPTIFPFEARYKPNQRINFIYSGSIKRWHMFKEALLVFQGLYGLFGDKVHLTVCVNDKGGAVDVLRRIGLDISSYTLLTAPYEDMPAYYNDAHYGFCLTRPSVVASVCSPVKFAEYLAYGVMVIVNEGVGDLPDIIEKYGCGVVVDDSKDISSMVNCVAAHVDLMLGGCAIYDPTQLKCFSWGVVVDDIYGVYLQLSS